MTRATSGTYERPYFARTHPVFCLASSDEQLGLTRPEENRQQPDQHQYQQQQRRALSFSEWVYDKQ